MSRFSPWSGIAAHEPLGNINRARKSVYRLSAEFRERFNGCPIHQPRRLAELPFPDAPIRRAPGELPRRSMPTGPVRGRRGVTDMSPQAWLLLGVAVAAFGAFLYTTRSDQYERG